MLVKEDGVAPKEGRMSNNKLISKLKTKEELKNYYLTLSGEYEGYVQMSDSRFKDEHLLYTSQSLPAWDTLHPNDINYILEMALFDGEQSILVRQHNDKFLVLTQTLDGTEPVDTYYTATSKTIKMKIAQIWEDVPNEFCENFNVLEPKALMFAGFDNAEGGKS